MKSLFRASAGLLWWFSLQAAPAAPFDVGVGAGTLTKPRGLWKPTLLLPDREVKVWLPPGYEADDQTRYPVMYVHDGQNAMEDSTSWTGHSWRLGAALTKLLEDGAIAQAPIVVMIDNAPGDAFGLPMVRRRHLEYGDGWLAKPYRKHVATVVKPAIDAKFRTLAGPAHTAQLGTSLGGAAAFLAAWERPEVFGAAACLSPAFSAATLAEVAAAAARGDGPAKRLQHARIYLDNGGDADGKTVPLLEAGDVVDAALAAVVAVRGAAAAAAEAPVAARLNPGYFWLDTYLQPGVATMASLLLFHGLRLSDAHNRAPADASGGELEGLRPSSLVAAAASAVGAWRGGGDARSDARGGLAPLGGGGNLAYYRAAGARHNEKAWAARMARPLLHLYGPEGADGRA